MYSEPPTGQRAANGIQGVARVAEATAWTKFDGDGGALRKKMATDGARYGGWPALFLAADRTNGNQRQQRRAQEGVAMERTP